MKRAEEKGIHYAAFKLERGPKKRAARLRVEHLRATYRVGSVEASFNCNETPKGRREDAIRKDKVIDVQLSNMPRLRAVMVHGGRRGNSFARIPE